MSWLKDLQKQFLQDMLDKNTGTDYLTHAHRINAYTDGYYTRLKQSIAFKFDTLCWYAQGEELTQRIDDFVTSSIPHHHNINFYGLEFKNYLEKKKAPSLWLDLAETHMHTHLAKFEKHIPPVQLASYANHPINAWAASKFCFQKSMRLFTTSHPVHAIFDAFAHSGEKPIPTAGTTYYVTYQKKQKIYFESLPPQEYVILSSLHKQISLGDALSTAQDPSVAQDLFNYFHKWQTYQLITGIDFA